MGSFCRPPPFFPLYFLIILQGKNQGWFIGSRWRGQIGKENLVKQMPKDTDGKGLEEENSCAIWGTYISVFFLCVRVQFSFINVDLPPSRVQGPCDSGQIYGASGGRDPWSPPLQFTKSMLIGATWTCSTLLIFSSLCCSLCGLERKKENVVLPKLACDWSLFVRLSILLIRLLFLSIYGTCVYRLTCLFHQRADRPPFDLFGTEQSPTRVSTSFILLFLCFLLGCFLYFLFHPSFYFVVTLANSLFLFLSLGCLFVWCSCVCVCATRPTGERGRKRSVTFDVWERKERERERVLRVFSR